MVPGVVNLASDFNGRPTNIPSSIGRARSPCSSTSPISTNEHCSSATRHIRFTTPSSSLCKSSPDVSVFSTATRRAQTREDSPPSALAFLAAICASPSVRWDGTKHHYLEVREEREKLVYCEKERIHQDESSGTHDVDLEDCASTRDNSTLSFVDIEDHSRITAVPIKQSPLSPGVEDEQVLAPGVLADLDYISEFAPSSPTAISISSPSHRMSCDFSSSSDRSVTLPLSSPGPFYLKRSLSSTPTTTQQATWTPHVSLPGAEAGYLELKSEPSDTLLPGIDSKPAKFESPRMRSRSVSPLRAPSPSICVDIGFSPLNSPLSSLLSEPVDLEPPSAVSGRFSICSSAVSSRSASPDLDMMGDSRLNKHVGAGRRASTNVISTDLRRITEDMTVEHRPRSDTAPPEPTPRKRRRRSSPVLRAVQFQRLSSPHSPISSCSKPLITSSVVHRENRQVSRKRMTKTKKRSASISALSSKPFRAMPETEPHPHLTSSGESKFSTSKSKIITASNPIQSNLDTPSAADLATLPMTGFLVETLALSRASAMAAPELLRAVLKSQPHLMEARSEESWLVQVRQILERVKMFGRIERKGTDAADRPLEDQWFYIPEHDEEDGRAELLKGLMPNKRNVTKRSKQYYFEPVHKVSRWDPEDD